MSREQLVDIARRSLAHRAAGTQDQAGGVHTVPASNYFDPDRWRVEMDNVFLRLPLVVAGSCELPNTGDYLAGEIVDTPFLLIRGSDGEVRAFLNMCSHRGSVIAKEGTGNTRRHTCPYHAWTYDESGDLVGVLDAADFGEVDRSCNGLTALPCAERAGLIWIHLRPEAKIDIDTFLGGYGDLLEHLDFASCHPAGRQAIDGPNWKVAYDGYLDFYHLPILHKDTFGPQMSTKAQYDAWGPHQRVTSPERGNEKLLGVPEDEWEIEHLISGVWTIFPHVSIAAFDANGKVWMVSMLYPGSAPESSTTVQLFLHTRPPDDEQAEVMEQRLEFNRYVVGQEDYSTGLRLQKALQTGGKPVALFGRNEGGGQHFHRFLDQLLEVDDADLATFFKNRHS
jgi:phenylpropionate dioxygenase-like ring-hydroxylating dioxygenase large terminal subunit